MHQHRLEVLEVVGQLVEAKILGDAIHAPGLGVGLEGTEKNLPGVFLVVGAAVVVAQHGQVRRHALERIGHHVEVLAGVKRHVDADGGRKRAGPHAGREHHRLRRNRAFWRVHARDALAVVADGGDGDVFADQHAAVPRALGERAAHVDGVGLAVRGDEDPAHHVVDGDERIALLDLVGAEHVDAEVEHLGHGRAALQLLEAALMGGERDRAVLLEAGGLAGLRFEARVKLGRILGELGHPLGGAQLADEAGGVPGGAAGELAALQQHHVGDARAREMVGDGAAHHPAADDDHAGRARQVRSHQERPAALPDTDSRCLVSAGLLRDTFSAMTCASVTCPRYIPGTGAP